MCESIKSAVVAVDVQSLGDQLATLTTQSARIRFLASNGFTRSQIATKLGLQYEHVRRVLRATLTNKD